jgi:hypothetical protein
VWTIDGSQTQKIDGSLIAGKSGAIK